MEIDNNTTSTIRAIPAGCEDICAEGEEVSVTVKVTGNMKF